MQVVTVEKLIEFKNIQVALSWALNQNERKQGFPNKPDDLEYDWLQTLNAIRLYIITIARVNEIVPIEYREKVIELGFENVDYIGFYDTYKRLCSFVKIFET